MEDTLTTIIGIGISFVLMFIFPLMTVADRGDDVSQLTVNVATSEFVNDVRVLGYITSDMYSKFINDLETTGNRYNVQLELKIKDENPARKTVENNSNYPGENAYYSIYTSQILDQIGIGKDDANANNKLVLKEGDIFSVNVNNVNMTISQQLKNFFYRVVGRDTYVIASSQSGQVIATGR